MVVEGERGETRSRKCREEEQKREGIKHSGKQFRRQLSVSRAKIAGQFPPLRACTNLFLLCFRCPLGLLLLLLLLLLLFPPAEIFTTSSACRSSRHPVYIRAVPRTWRIVANAMASLPILSENNSIPGNIGRRMILHVQRTIVIQITISEETFWESATENAYEKPTEINLESILMRK